MRLIWYIALGGAAGSVARYAIGLAVQTRTGLDFPLGTLIVNLTGCLLLGFLIRYTLATPAVSSDLRALLTVGLCGGYTTFSTFGYETVALMQDGDWRRAALYVAVSIGGSLLGVLLGMAGAQLLLNLRQSI